MVGLSESDKEMIQSCFTYGTDWLEDNQFLQPIIDRCGLTQVKDYLTYLDYNFEVVHNVYEDMEGCTYNQLIPKNHEDKSNS